MKSDCKNCIHYEGCHIAEWFEVGKEYAENSCRFFKDRSKFIELPCKVGDTVYILHRVKARCFLIWTANDTFTTMRLLR